MTPEYRNLVLTLCAAAIFIATLDYVNNGVRLKIAVPCTIAFVLGACLILFSKERKY